MSVRLRVENLPAETTGESVRKLFLEEAGATVQVRLVTDRHGRSRGIAVVEAPDGVDWHDLVLAVDGLELDGRAVRVTLEDPEPGRTPVGRPPREAEEDDGSGFDRRRRPRARQRDED